MPLSYHHRQLYFRKSKRIPAKYEDDKSQHLPARLIKRFGIQPLPLLFGVEFWYNQELHDRELAFDTHNVHLFRLESGDYNLKN